MSLYIQVHLAATFASGQSRCSIFIINQKRYLEKLIFIDFDISICSYYTYGDWLFR